MHLRRKDRPSCAAPQRRETALQIFCPAYLLERDYKKPHTLGVNRKSQNSRKGAGNPRSVLARLHGFPAAALAGNTSVESLKYKSVLEAVPHRIH